MTEREQPAVHPQEEYIESLYPRDEVLDRVLVTIREQGMPDISVAPAYGRLLTFLVRLSGAKSALEIGALGGYSGICLARGLPSDGRLTSLELKQDYAELALANLGQAGFGAIAEVRVGDAMESLHALQEEGARYDFFFIDADKGNYPEYLDTAIALSNPGALIVGDNIFLRGRTISPASQGHSAQQVRRFNERIAQDPRLEGVLLPAYDGLAIARVR